MQVKCVGVVSASPMSMGLLSERGPPAWHPAPQDVRDACKRAVDYCKVINIAGFFCLKIRPQIGILLGSPKEYLE